MVRTMVLTAQIHLIPIYLLVRQDLDIHPSSDKLRFRLPTNIGSILDLCLVDRALASLLGLLASILRRTWDEKAA